MSQCQVPRFHVPDWPGLISSHTERCIKTTRQVSSCLVAWDASISTFSQLISLQTGIRNHAKVAVIGGLGERQMLRVTLTYITPFLISENYARHRVGLQTMNLWLVLAQKRHICMYSRKRHRGSGRLFLCGCSAAYLPKTAFASDGFVL